MTFIVAGVPLLLAALTATALAFVVFIHGPGRTVNRCLSAFLFGEAAFAFGAAMAAFSSGDSVSLHASVWHQWTFALNFIGLLAVPLALSWPERRRWAPGPFATLWPYATAWVLLAWLRAVFDTTASGRPEDILSVSGILRAIDLVAWLAQWAMALMLIVEARRAPAGPLREGRILLALGLSLLSVYVAFRNVASPGRFLDAMPESGSIGWLGIVTYPAGVLATVAIAWLASRLQESHALRVARWLLPLAILSGLADAFLWYAGRVWSGPFVPGYEARFFLFGFWTLMPMALLAYVVLKGQIEGLDLRVRWGISRSTIAGAFVAAFFIASEGAQIVFGRDNELVGLLAAGALVFAIAPLQRAAERLAEKAVPLAASSPTGVQGEASFRNAARLAMRDRTLTRAEETHLHELARDLGLDGVRAHAIIAETEAEAAGGAAP